jgi:hypothetical protein
MKVKIMLLFATLILSGSCKSGNDDSITMGDLWQWHLSTMTLLFSGYFSQLTILQVVWIIFCICSIFYLVLLVGFWRNFLVKYNMIIPH